MTPVSVNTTPHAIRNTARGFTLIELMISLVLGLMITAAVLQVYIANVRTSAIQQSGSDLQYASIFGIQQLESHLRLANLGNPVTEITDSTPMGGIVLTLANIGEDDVAYKPYFTHAAGDTGFTSVSNIQGINSDQLTIQYTNTTGEVLFDCEGMRVEVNDRAIERYFLRASSVVSQGIILACDAGRIVDTGIQDYPSTNALNFGSHNSEFISGVDQFKVMLGTQDTSATPQMRYVTAAQYMTLSPRPAITAVKIGLIVRGNNLVIGSDTQQSFNVFATTHTLKSGKPKQVRTNYESTTLLRNARVVSVDVGLPNTATTAGG